MTQRNDYKSRYTRQVLPSVTWTEESEDHIARHRVEPFEVEEVLYGRPRYLTPGRDETTLAHGVTAAGRYLFVVIGDAPDGGVSIVTARDMTMTERRLFHRKGS